MDAQNRPQGRGKKVVTGGKGVEKKGEGLGTGPVNNTGNYAGREKPAVIGSHQTGSANPAQFGGQYPNVHGSKPSSQASPLGQQRPASAQTKPNGQQRPASTQMKPNGQQRPASTQANSYGQQRLASTQANSYGQQRPASAQTNPFVNNRPNGQTQPGSTYGNTENGRPTGQNRPSVSGGLGSILGALGQQNTSAAQNNPRPATAGKPQQVQATGNSGNGAGTTKASAGRSGCSGKLLLIVLAVVVIFGGIKLIGNSNGGQPDSSGTSNIPSEVGSLLGGDSGSVSSVGSTASSGTSGIANLLSSFMSSAGTSDYDFSAAGSGSLPSFAGTDFLSSLLGGYAEDAVGSSNTGSTTVSTSTNSQKPDTTVSSKARDKRVVLKGKGKDKVTIMVYMCGTDLESQSGMATSDLKEMTNAELGENVNLLVYTGGCKRWKNSVVSSSVNQIYQIRDGGLYCLEKDMGNASMTKPETLTAFLKYGAKNFPANRMCLIFWDHGGGSVSGYGYDERYGKGSMTLKGIDQALSSAGVTFDFIGFDACLMATVENGLMLSKYADYMIASEESEPGVGWYYTDWLTKLGSNSSLSTVEIGKNITDDFIRVCNQTCRGQATTLSVVDLAELEATAPSALTDFAVDTSEEIQSNYAYVAKARSSTREFAQSSRIDQIDLVDFAKRMGTAEGEELAAALLGAVKYNRTSGGMTNAYGLSIYFPNRKTNQVSQAVSTFEAIGMDDEYTRCIQEFASMMVSGQVTGGYGNYQTSGNGYGYSSQGSVGSLLDLLGGGGYNSSSYTASSTDSMMDILGGLFGGSSSSSGLGFFSGRSLTAQTASDYISTHRIDLEQLAWDSQNHIHLDDDQWDLVENVLMNVFVDDGNGYIDLGMDNLFTKDNNGDLVGEYDGTWVSINKQPVAYYYLGDAVIGDVSITTGYVPAYLNGSRVNLIVMFDPDTWYGFIAGAQTVYANGEADTQAKNMIRVGQGDELRFICDYYSYSGEYQDSYYLGDAMTLGSKIEIANTDIQTDHYRVTWCLEDIYQQKLWTPVLP